MRRADVVVIGGGVIGCSIAWHLAAAGVRDVVVIDRAAEIGTGSTAKATGGFRLQYGSDVNIRLSLLSREKLLRFNDEVGGDAEYRPIGYLFLAASEEQKRLLGDAIALQNRFDIPSRLVRRDEVAPINPAVASESHHGGSFCPHDGTIRPLGILRGYYDAARSMGVRFELGTEPTAIAVHNSRVQRVETTAGPIECGSVVNAAGAWAASVAAMAGVSLPVQQLRRCVVPTVPTDVIPPTTPLTIFLGDGFHFRERDGRVLLLWPDTPEGDPADTNVPPQWLARVRELTDERVPPLRNVAFDRAAAWGGLYEMSPDRHVILGALPEIENLLFANGSSGHGVMHAPAIGQLVSELVRGEATSFDVRPLRPSRFAEGALLESQHLL